MPSPEKMELTWQFNIPETSATAIVQLAVVQRLDDGALALRLELNVGGPPLGQSEELLKKWFDIAHDWIVRSFDDLLAPEKQVAWGRYYD